VDALHLLPFFILMLPFAIGNYALAGRLGRSRAGWLILSLIPLVNYFFLIYVAYVVVLRVLDSLAAGAVRPDAAQR
jgi:hypothetical protein